MHQTIKKRKKMEREEIKLKYSDIKDLNDYEIINFINERLNGINYKYYLEYDSRYYQVKIPYIIPKIPSSERGILPTSDSDEHKLNHKSYRLLSELNLGEEFKDLISATIIELLNKIDKVKPQDIKTTLDIIQLIVPGIAQEFAHIPGLLIVGITTIIVRRFVEKNLF